MKLISYGRKIKVDEDNLTIEMLLKISNGKRTNCINFEKCNEFFIFDDEEDINWACPTICFSYQNSDQSNYKFLYFSDEAIKKASDYIDKLTEKQRFRFFSEVFLCRQEHEKYGGVFLVEESTRTTLTDGRSKEGRSRRGEKQDRDSVADDE
jgi:hypothetical protein